MQLNFIMPTFVLEDMEAVKGKQSFKRGKYHEKARIIKKPGLLDYTITN